MTYDHELARLRTERAQACQAKRAAQSKRAELFRVYSQHRDQQDQAWHQKESAKQAMNDAWNRLQQAYDNQRKSWERYRQIQHDNSVQIAKLNQLSDQAHQDMCQAFDRSNRARSDGDEVAARQYSDIGQELLDKRDGYANQVQRLITDSKAAKANLHYHQYVTARVKAEHYRLRSLYLSAKANFTQAKQEFEQAKADYRAAQSEVQEATLRHSMARKAFQDRQKMLAESDLTAQSARREQEIARQACVPSEYLDDIIVKQDPLGITNVYFGGADRPDGDNHGHATLDQQGKVIYMRLPGQPHGAQNYVVSSSGY